LEIWLPYGDVESLVTLQAENIGELVDPAPEGRAEELGLALVERLRGFERLVVCDSKPSTLKVVRAAAPGLPPDGQTKVYARSPRSVEDVVPELKGRVLKVSPPPTPTVGEATFSPELETGTTFALSTGEPDPLFGYVDARVALGLSCIGGVRKAAYQARGRDEPAFFEETPSYALVRSLVERVSGAAFGTIVPRGGEPFSVIEGGGTEARALLAPKEVSPAKGIVVGAGGRGYDESFSHVLRLSLAALRSVRKGGDLLLVGECREGLGSEALHMLATGRAGEGAIRKGFYADGMEEIAYLNALREDYSVTLLSSLPELYASASFRFRTAKNSAEALQKVFGSTGRGAKLHVFTRACEALLA